MATPRSSTDLTADADEQSGQSEEMPPPPPPVDPSPTAHVSAVSVKREAPSLLAYRSAIMVRPGRGTVSDTEHHERGDKILARRWHAGAKICKRGPRSSFGTPRIEPVHRPEDAARCSPDSECAPASSAAAL